MILSIEKKKKNLSCNCFICLNISIKKLLNTLNKFNILIDKIQLNTKSLFQKLVNTSKASNILIIRYTYTFNKKLIYDKLVIKKKN